MSIFKNLKWGGIALALIGCLPGSSVATMAPRAAEAALLVEAVSDRAVDTPHEVVASTIGCPKALSESLVLDYPKSMLFTVAPAADEEPSVSLMDDSGGGSATYGTSVSFLARVSNLSSSDSVDIYFYNKGDAASHFAWLIGSPMPGSDTVSILHPVSLTGDTWKPGDYSITAKVTINGVTYSSDPVTLTVTKANQSLTSPSASSKTSASVTLNTVTGQGEVKYACVEGENQLAPTDENSWQTDTTFSNLKPATAYTFFARSAGNDCYNGATSSAVIYTNYAAPTGLYLLSPVVNQATAMWKNISGATSYSVQLYKGEETYGNAVQMNPAPGDNSAYTFNITEAGTYSFTVKATSELIDGDVSQKSSAKTYYKVTFDSNGGSSVSSQYATSGANLTEPTDPNKAGFTFGGWYKTANLTGDAWNFGIGADSVSTSDVTLYAKWLSTEAGVKSVTVNEQSATVGDNNTFDVILPYGTKITSDTISVVPADEKATVSGPQADENDNSKWTFTVTAEDGQTVENYTISVTFTPVDSTLTVEPTEDTLTYGNELEIKVTPGIAAANGISALATAQNTVELYNGDKLLASTTTANDDGSYTLTYDTKNQDLYIGSNTLIVSFGGNNGLNPSTAEVTVTLEKANVSATLDGTTSKTYDSTAAAPSGLTVALTGVLDGDDVTASSSSITYDSADAGDNKTITAVGIALTGADAAYYSLMSHEVSVKTGSIAVATLSGALTIAGTAKYDQTLTANYTPVHGEQVSYQWYRDGQPIAEATGGAYTLAADDVNKAITVTATAADGNHSGSVTSDPVTVNKATGSIEIACASVKYGTTAQPTVTRNTNTGAKVTYSYSGTGETKYGPTNVAPTEVGSYSVTATVAATDTHTEATSAAVPFSITSANSDLDISPSSASVTYGETLTLTFIPKVAAVNTLSTAQNTVELLDEDGNVLASDSEPDSEGSYTLVYDTKDQKLDAGAHILTVSYGGNGNLNPSTAEVEVTLNKKSLTAELTGTFTKVYDGTDDVPGNLALDLKGVLEGDDVAATVTTIAYDGADAGGRTITASGIELSGDDAAYYELEDGTVIAGGSISAAQLSGDLEISGDAVFGETLHAEYTKVHQETVMYQWLRDGQDIGGATDDSYVLTAEDVNKSITVTATATDQNHTGSVTSDSVAVAKASGAAPAAGEGYAIDFASETVGADGGYELSVSADGTSGSATLSVTPGTDVYIRKAETGTHTASAWTVVDVPARPDTPAPPTVADRTDDSIVLADLASGIELKLDRDDTWRPVGGPSFTLGDLEPATSYTVFARVAATDSSFASESVELSVSTKVSAAAAPQVGEPAVTATSVVLPQEAGWEYSADGEGWTEEHEFTGLEPARQYTFYVRVAETEDAEASKVAAVTVWTAHAAPAAGEGYAIDFAAETLAVEDGFEVNASEDFSGAAIADGGSVSDYAGATLYIRHAADEVGAPASAAVSISVPARPAAPQVTGGIQKIEGATTAMEWSTDDGATWERFTDETVSYVPAGAYLVRFAATGEAFAGEPTGEITVSNPAAPPVSSGVDWDDVADTITSTEEGGSVVVEMDGETELPGEVLETIAGSDVTLVLDMGDGVSWEISGSDVPADATFDDLDLGVSLGTSGIPVDVVNLVTGEREAIQVTLAHNGPFGFELSLVAPLGQEGEGLVANLYCFDEETQTLDFESYGTVDVDGNARLRLDHASQWAIVLDTRSHALPFADTSEGQWYSGSVRWAWLQGIMTGYAGSDLFGTDDGLTRAQMAAVLYNVAGRPGVEVGALPSDCDADAWYAECVAWALSEGVFNGYGDGSTFGPDDLLTREQAACVLMNAAAVRGEDVSARADLSAYPDAGEVSGWASDALSWAVAEGVLSGFETADGARELKPGRACTRVEMAALMMNLSSRG